MDLDSVSSHSKNMHEREEATLNQLLKLEEDFRNYYALTLKEMKIQTELVERMWILSQRYRILISTGPCCKFPEVYAAPAEEVILHEYHDKLKQIRSSNCRMWNSLRYLRIGYKKFEQLCSELDMSRQTPLIIGDAYHKPISFFIELVDDLFKYFHASILELKYRSHLLEPEDSQPLEDYKALLECSEDFEEYLMKGLVYCKCLRPKQACTNIPDLRVTYYNVNI